MRDILKTLGPAALAILLVALGSPTALAQESTPGGGDTVTEGEVELGVWDASEDGSLDVAAEYEPTDGGADARLDLETRNDTGRLAVDGSFRGDDDAELGVDFDVRRMIRSSTEYTALLHRFIHDDLDNFAAATDHGRIVEHTDLDPDAVYGIDWELLEHRTELQLPAAPGWTLGVGYRKQDREGERQLTTVSHCSTCHVVGQSRPVDESTEDTTIDLQYAWTGGSVEGSFTHRELDEGNRFVTLLFDDALQPELQIPIFDNKLQWDLQDGPQPVDLVPEITKDRAKLRASFADVGGFAVNLGGVWTETENGFTDLSSEYLGSVLSAAKRFRQGWNLVWRAKAYSIDNDDVFVDTVEPESIAGPQVGLTFREVYGFDPDFTRRSALDREVLSSDLEVTRRFGGLAGTVKALWTFENVDREHLAVTNDGDTDTTENVFGLSWWTRPATGWRLEASWRHGEVDNPFLAIDDQFSTLESPTVSSPFAPSSAQYFEFQRERIGDGTALPESWDQLQARVSYNFGNNSFSASHRWWSGDNEAGDLTEWERTNQSAMATLWMAPAPDWSWYATVAWHDTELDLAASIPIFDG